MDLKAALQERMRTVPDFPKPGIFFKDITPILQDPPLLARCTAAITEYYTAVGFDLVAGIEARGFIFGALIAHTTGKPFIPFRKAGKLPAECLRESYSLEYGQAEIEVHADAIAPGQRVLIVDDLLATGGTAAAAVKLVERAGGSLAGVAFLIELTFLDGRARLLATGAADEQILSLVGYGANE